jgi:hypothetical protein
VRGFVLVIAKKDAPRYHRAVGTLRSRGWLPHDLSINEQLLSANRSPDEAVDSTSYPIRTLVQL